MPDTYDIRNFTFHNQADGVLGDWLGFTTGPRQWAYAVELPLQEPPQQTVRTRIDIRVTSGAIGVGSLRADRDSYFHEIQVVAADDWTTVEVLTGTGIDAGPLILRNTSSHNQPSRADMRILDIAPASDVDVAQVSEIEIDPVILSRFKSWSGVVPGGYWAEWTGALTRAGVWAFDKAALDHYSKERYEAPSVPLDREHVLDWIPLAEAVASSGSTFRMAALGAGWGRWLISGAFLAKQIGKDYRLIGVEAEPRHFDWLNEHIDLNRLDRTKVHLFNAAATHQSGDCWFDVGGDPQSWYGQSVRDIEGEVKGDYTQGPHGLLKRTLGLTLVDLVGYETPLDYVHMDIQGAEAAFLCATPDVLDKHVRMVNVGTHSLEIEADLRKLFQSLGWRCQFDIPLSAVRSLRIGDQLIPQVEFGDGVQVWVNQGLPAG